YHQQAIGVLVIQTISADSITESDIPIFENITSQIAATVAYTGILKSFSGQSGDLQGPDTASPAGSRFQRNYLRGESVSFGVAEGYAHYLPENISFSQVHCTLTEDSGSDLRRIERAFEKAGTQIQHIAEQAKALSTEESGIIEAHLMFLRDKSLKQKIRSKIESGNCAEYALKETVYEYVDMFRSIENPYLNDRSADILDIGQRVLENLIGGANGENPAFSRETIVIASDLSPVDLLAIRQDNLKGVVLVNGGRTSHTVILAKSFEIPIVIGVDGVLDTVRENDYLILDGSSGFVFANPPDEIQVEYERRRKEREQAIEDMAVTLGLAATTRDDFTVQVGANIGLLSDTELVAKYRADFVGLYRTEFPFMLRKSFPTEEEQVALYCKILEHTAPLSVTIRTFDAGGDKMFSSYEGPVEDNPFLGWRSIRISLDMEDIFRTQIRAILRASAFGNTNILFPMISCITEVHRIRSIVAEEKENLRQQDIAFDPDIQMGIMVEVPGVVPILERVLNYVDFVSIGTNDLIQYLLAVDRNNKRVASRYNLLHPSVVTTIASIVSTCRQAGKPVSICGESAANPQGIFLFVGMGADRLSMTPSAIAAAKSFIRSIRRSDARKCLEEALEKEDAGAISRLLQVYLDQSRQLDAATPSMHLTDV
ncbi:MAG TPA: phosphoenolpyruvate--protein phosphotransferase, partial [Desulfosalsimonadaceae bacterium]|nr:phosphoenolpyruvate--protein phosphotransferase [Desulfosalsimonadaceae bacterium]